MKNAFLKIFALMACIVTAHSAFAQKDSTVKVLVVMAHPDDEGVCSATVYKITHELHGTVDLALLSNGEGGYKYSTLAEAYYGLELTDPAVGRQFLPTIRKRELLNAGKIIGIRNYYFFDQVDDKYSTDEHIPLDTLWNVNWIQQRLGEIMTSETYDFVFCLLPTPQTHGQHKAASILALRTVKKLKATDHPIVLAVTNFNKTDTVKTSFDQLADYKETKIKASAPNFIFDRSTKFGYKDALDYKIIVRWELAEHKSQGTVHTGIPRDCERFLYFDINDDSGIIKTQKLFDRLKEIHFKARNY